jgi:hypothetical protein
MPKKSRRLGPRWTIPGKLAMAAKWAADKPGMLARSEAGGEATRKVYAERLTAIRNLLASWPTDLTMKEIRERIEAERLPDDSKPDSIIRRMREHRLIVFDLVSGRWHNLCRIAPPSNPLNL